MVFIKKLSIYFFTIFALLFGVLVYRAIVLFQPCVHNLAALSELNRFNLTQDVLNRFRNSLKFPTVSYDFGNQNFAELKKYVDFIRHEFTELESYSFVHLEIVNNYSLLYKINGLDSNLKPYLLTAHYDVVPVDGQKWTYDPFAAKIDNGYIYSRGTLDDKSNMIAQLEAMRTFLKKNGQPMRSVYLAYGHDEEISGLAGAAQMAKRLENVELEYVIDEGMFILEDLMTEVKRPIATIGIAEKGYLTVKFSINTTGGHSAMPDKKESALFILSEALNKLVNIPLPSMLGKGPEKDILEKLAVHSGFFQRLFLTNMWLFNPLIEKILRTKNTMDALQRTTTAVTKFNGGVKDNVMPTYAEFVVNHRIHSMQTCQEILDLDLKIINNPSINYEILDCINPSPISPVSSLGYELIEHTVMQLYPDSISVPGLVIAMTDSRFYQNNTRNVYKFTGIKMKMNDIKSIHSYDERISIENYENLINFFLTLIKNTENAHLIKEKATRVEL